MTIQNRRTTIPEDFRDLLFRDLLESKDLAHVATIGSRGEPQSSPDPYQNHGPGDERVVTFVGPEHTTRKDG